MMTEPHMATVGDDGPELIVPIGGLVKPAIWGREDGPELILDGTKVAREIAEAFRIPEALIGLRPPWYRRWWQHWSRRPVNRRFA